MDFDEITRILEMMREHELSEFELERDNFKLRIRKHAGGQWVVAAPPSLHGQVMPAPPASSVSHGTGAPAAASTPVLTAADDEMEFAVVKSPMVGTFYRAPSPDAKPFVDVGATVKVGETICVLEAMKLMNEINAEIDGEIVKVYVENGHAVQYGERLFGIKPASA